MRRRTAIIGSALLASSAHAQLSIRWYSIDNGGSVSTAGQTTLRGVIGQTDTLLLSSGSLTLQGGFLASRGPVGGCPADIDGNGVLDANDFFAYLDLFATGDPGADLDANGTIDANDFFLYLDFFVLGC